MIFIVIASQFPRKGHSHGPVSCRFIEIRRVYWICCETFCCHCYWTAERKKADDSWATNYWNWMIQLYLFILGFFSISCNTCIFMEQNNISAPISPSHFIKSHKNKTLLFAKNENILLYSIRGCLCNRTAVLLCVHWRIQSICRHATFGIFTSDEFP